jgi:hypothetical protein
MFHIRDTNTRQIPNCQIVKFHIATVELVSFEIGYNLQVAQIFIKLPKTNFLLAIQFLKFYSLVAQTFFFFSFLFGVVMWDGKGFQLVTYLPT